MVIAGGGFAGLTLAVALRQALGASFSVIVADPALGRTHAGDLRASAIAAAARRLFETIGVWEEAARDAQPILDMAITDSRLNDSVRPVFLTFGGEVVPGEPFAHMIENKPLVDALLAKAKAEGVELRATTVAEFENSPERVAVEFGDGEAVSARLLIAADGARSFIRERCNIQTVGWDYGQSGIVTTVAHERDTMGAPRSIFFPPDRSRFCR